MAEKAGKQQWSEIKARLRALNQGDLVALVGDLYRASGDNRRILHTRLLGSAKDVEKYRKLIIDAVAPDPFSRNPIARISEAKRLIREYKLATNDPAGAMDLMLSFVEAGTNQAAEYGCEGDDIAPLAAMVGEIAKLVDNLPLTAQEEALERLWGIAATAAKFGWGFGDYVEEVAVRLSDTLNLRPES
jgi:hypothetical protein